MIMHLPRLVPAPDREARRRFDRARRLDIEGAGGGEPRCRGGEQIVPDRVAERRVEEDHVEAPALARDESERIRAVYFERGRAETRGGLGQRADEVALPIDRDGVCRAPRKGFERERSAARERVERSQSREILPK